MRAFLVLVGRDWMRAPISGTVALLFSSLGVWYMWDGMIDRGLLCMILGNVVQTRGIQATTPERHPACVAPHCLRGGKCHGPCKLDR